MFTGGERKKMLSKEEIKKFIEEDAASEKKHLARVGQQYYEGDHDIKDYQVYYIDSEGNPVLDTTRSNIKIAHPFFTELVDQGTQYILSGEGYYIKSDKPELQAELDSYFNENEDFTAELTELLTGCQAKGFEYMYAYKNEEDRTAFQCADALGVIEVRAKDTDSQTDHVIYWYTDRVAKDNKKIKRIEVRDAEQTAYYVQVDNGDIEEDMCFNGTNIKPHALYQKDNKLYSKVFGYVPFFRLDNNKKQTSGLKVIKPIIDDYDIMNCGLSNNIQDGSEMYWVVKGFQGDSLDELIHNVKSKKHIGVDEEGGVDIRTVDIPYQARQAKLQEDEKNIYRFGFGLNTSGLKDTAATTNIAIKAAYSLLDLRCSKLIIRLKQFLRKLLKVVLAEINEVNGTDYQQKDVYFNFQPEIISNALENAQIALTEAQEQQTRITTLLNLAAQLDNETLMQNICEVLDIDYEEIKGKLPQPDEAEAEVGNAQAALNNVQVEEPVE